MEEKERDFSNANLARIAEFIEFHFGIRTPETKKQLLINRLANRLRAHGLASYNEYCEKLFAGHLGATELGHFADAITTNKTDFFREPRHFELLGDTILRAMRSVAQARPLRIWSAACSSGEEPWSIALTLAAQSLAPVADFEVLASDISTAMLRRGLRAIYPKRAVEPIPRELVRAFLLRHQSASPSQYRICPALRAGVSFRRINLMAPSYPVRGEFDAIFCRNALIYFNAENSEAIINKLLKSLRPGGFFFIGHSESLMGMRVALKYFAPGVFIKR